MHRGRDTVSVGKVELRLGMDWRTRREGFLLEATFELNERLVRS
jgi:hypothetical protein